ncbi:hypothetical protein QEJ31_01055 [Pigmentibacter sp. JX0631]|uniref:hypothetical protein n=1 Tax=Pigmentibacter sp. JX0631 TaxID=2976982 RepID=UPI0024690D3C|nr:hypothetical protein [Pigmentibacter sp. JX0631]WGL60191.1 hypothetical protein QEJ31_01055 [Pigmentibacter sp. JX0631]
MKQKKEIFLCKISGKIWNNKNKTCQAGQVLFSGLFLIIFSLSFSLFFLFISESYIRNYSNVNIARNSVLKERAVIANILNEISINNYLIVHAIKFAEKYFLQASELSMYNAYSQPYWETFSKINNSASLENYLANYSEKSIKLNFETFSASVARNLYIAKSLSFRNITLFNKLPKKVASNFKFSENNSTFCLALESNKNIFKYPGNFFFPILENFYTFQFSKNECEVFHKRNKFFSFLANLPFLKADMQDKFLFLEKNSSISNSLHYSLLYVPFAKKESFLTSLASEAPTDVYFKNSYVTFFNLVQRTLIKSLDKKLLAKHSKHISANIIHRNHFCKKDHSELIKNKNNFFSSNNLHCSISENDFLFSFFMPNWTAIISFEKDKLENEN